MCATESNRDARSARPKGAAAGLRVEPVDNWHAAWEQVLKAVARQGDAGKLKIDADGWLSARQVLMVAFIGKAPVAHVCFSVSPGKTGCVEAKLDICGIDPKHKGFGIESRLYRAAVDRANALRCEKLKGFRLGSQWR